jgi:hypothetical protein
MRLLCFALRITAFGLAQTLPRSIAESDLVADLTRGVIPCKGNFTIPLSTTTLGE